jgi:tRNA A37 threonylcarbamoyladenosine synthetase subunit TsaC/SUA5/YrdC
VTSANISGEPSPLNAQEAARLGDAVDLVLDGGQSPGNLASTVVDLTDGHLRIVREGPIDEAALRRALGS